MKQEDIDYLNQNRPENFSKPLNAESKIECAYCKKISPILEWSFFIDYWCDTCHGEHDKIQCENDDCNRSSYDLSVYDNEVVLNVF